MQVEDQGKICFTCKGTKISPCCSSFVGENGCGNVFHVTWITNVIQVKEFLYFAFSQCEDRKFLIKNQCRQDQTLQTQMTGTI